MATIKIILRTSKINSQGEAPLCIRIIKDRSAKFVFLDFRIRPEYWDDKEKRVKKSHPNHTRINNFIAAKLMEANGVALEMETEEKEITTEQIKEHILGKAPQSFYQFADKYLVKLDTNEQIATYRKTKSIIEKIREYSGAKDLMFHHINVSWLKEFEQHLKVKRKNCTNTINANFKVIRLIINLAIMEDLINDDKNPFKRLKMSAVHPKKDYLTELELKWMEQAPLQFGSNKDHHRNMYVFSAYAGGLRISDMLLLKWKNFDGQRISIQTKKTSSTVTIKLPEKALKILMQYKKEGNKSEDFIFPFLDANEDYTCKKKLFNAISSATAYTNDDLKEIAHGVGIEKKVSFHSARHTFATRALMKGMRIEYVSKLLGHSNIATTQIYAKIVSEELDRAMEIFN